MNTAQNHKIDLDRSIEELSSQLPEIWRSSFKEMFVSSSSGDIDPSEFCRHLNSHKDAEKIDLHGFLQGHFSCNCLAVYEQAESLLAHELADGPNGLRGLLQRALEQSPEWQNRKEKK